MPSYITHTLFGQDVLQQLQEDGAQDAANIIKANATAFQWGAQGPDILFFKNGFKKAPNPLGDYGAKMHKIKNSELFYAIQEYLATPDVPDAAKAYAYGFICHYCLDSRIHPYVYFMQEKLRHTYDSSLPYGIHMKLETDMDTAIYQKKVGGNIRAYKMDPALIEEVEQLNAIGDFQSAMLKKVYGAEFDAKDIVLCIQNDFKKERFVFDVTFYKSFLFFKILEAMRGEKNSQSVNCRPKKVNYDVLNEKHDVWFNFRDKTQPLHTSVLDLFAEGTQKASEMIQQMQAAVHGDMTLQFAEDMPTFDDGNPDVFGKME